MDKFIFDSFPFNFCKILPNFAVFVILYVSIFLFIFILVHQVKLNEIYKYFLGYKLKLNTSLQHKKNIYIFFTFTFVYDLWLL